MVIRQDGIILAGHRLVEAARLEGAESIICHVYDGPEEYAEAFLIADNRTSELAENDWSALGDLLQSLDDGSINMMATGYDDEALARLMHGLDDATGRLRERVLREQWQVLIECNDEQQQRALLERLTQEGYRCRALTS